MARSSRRNSARVATAVALTMLASVPALAHRRDEYLQAARIAVEPSRIAIELDITPGMAMAPAVVALLDGDRDGQISEREARAYAVDVQRGSGWTSTAVCCRSNSSTQAPHRRSR
jgi:hypothetical protein